MTLAIFGGKPVRESMLPYGRQIINADDRKAVEHVLRGDFLTTGPAVARFEEEFRAQTGSPNAVAVANGTAALHAAVRLLDLQPGEEVLTSPITFASTANAVLFEGGLPRFADIGDDTNLSPAALRETLDRDYKARGRDLFHKKTKKKLRAIIVVHYAGRAVDMTPFYTIARAHNLKVLEDASHALGAHYPGTVRCVGNSPKSLAVTFSFHPVKLIATGEGGMIAAHSRQHAGRLRCFRHHGIDLDHIQRMQKKVPHLYDMSELGYNYRLSDIHSALGISQLGRLRDFLLQRRALAAKYQAFFQDHELLRAPAPEAASEHAWHLYVVELKLKALKAKRDDIFRALRAENIGVNVHYLPVYRHSFYRKVLKGYAPACPRAEAFYEACLTLPLHAGMTGRDVAQVVEAVEKVLAHYKR